MKMRWVMVLGIPTVVLVLAMVGHAVLRWHGERHWHESIIPAR